MAKSTMKGVTSRKKGNSIFWYARVNDEKVYCGKGKKGQERAEAARGKYLSQRYQGLDEGAGLQIYKPKFSSIAALSSWYMDLPSIKKQVRYPAKVDFNKHLLRHLGDMPVNKVATDTLEIYRSKREVEGAASSTIDGEISLLRSMYRKAWKSRKIKAETIPAEFPVLDEHNPRRTITEDEYKRLLEAAPPDYKDVLIAGYETGMRSAEICKLTASQVHLGVSHISGQVVDYISLGIFDTKNRTERTIPVSAELKEVLLRRLEGLAEDDLVFTREGFPFTNVNISLRFKRACNKAKIPHGDKLLNAKGERIGLVFHSLRHSRITLWVQAGFSDELIRRASGHRSLAAYQRYVRLDPAAVMRLVENGVKPGQNLSKAASSAD
jgi:integrase